MGEADKRGNQKIWSPKPLLPVPRLKGFPSTSSPLEDAGSAMRLDATCRVANFEEWHSSGLSTVAGALENPSPCTVEAWVVFWLRWMLLATLEREGGREGGCTPFPLPLRSPPPPPPAPHGNVDGIMDGVKCVAVAPEVGIVGPHARSNKPG